MTASSLAYLEQDPLIISFSSRSTASFCWRKFEFYKLYNNVRSYRESIAAAAGSCIHAAHQEYMRTFDVDSAVMALIKTYPVQNNPELHDITAMRSFEACYATLMALIHTPKLMEYELADVKCLDGQVRPAIEVPFDIVLKGVTVRGRPLVYTGFIDYMFFNSFTGEYTTADLKTTRSYNNDLPAKYMFHGQCLPYGLVLQHISGKSINAFQTLYIHTFLDLLEPTVSPITFPKNAADVQDWFTGLVFFVRQLLEFENAGWYPRREAGCENMFHEKCKYMGVCNSRNPEFIQPYLVIKEENVTRDEHPLPWISFELDMPDSLKRAA